jgi:hypothetical protein
MQLSKPSTTSIVSTKKCNFSAISPNRAAIKTDTFFRLSSQIWATSGRGDPTLVTFLFFACTTFKHQQGSAQAKHHDVGLPLRNVFSSLWFIKDDLPLGTTSTYSIPATVQQCTLGKPDIPLRPRSKNINSISISNKKIS